MRFLTVLLLATALAVPVAGAAAAEDSARITVTGTGLITAKPDIATINLGVTSEGATAAEALSANSEKLAKVLANLRAAGVEDRDLQTSGLSLSPNWDTSSSTSGAAPRIAGYVAANMLNVRVRVLDKLGGILDAAVKDGANTLYGVNFDLADPAPVMDQARENAVRDARRRAELLTSAAGGRLGGLMSIREGGAEQPPVPMYRMNAEMASGAVPVVEGEVSLSSSVTIIWALEP